MPIDLEHLVAPTKETRFAKLFPAQAEILRIYAADAHELSDMAIELPTGGGKTLLALLILEYHRKQGKRVAILTGNKTLARQIEREAADLKVSIVRFEGSRDDISAKDLRAYHRGQAIAIMNYWVYINQNPAMEPAEVLVLDDAQLAEGALSSLFAARIDRHDHPELFAPAMELFMQYAESTVVEDVVKERTSEPWSPTDLIPFPAVFAMFDELDALVEAAIEATEGSREYIDLSFRWRRVRAKAKQSLVLVNSHEIVVRPYIYPTQDFRHLSAPRQRIFMSATVHDPEDLRRRLGTPPITKLPIGARHKAQPGPA